MPIDIGVYTMPQLDDEADIEQAFTPLLTDLNYYRQRGVLFAKRATNVSGNAAAGVEFQMAPTVTVPAAPFGAGVSYLVIARIAITAVVGTNAGFFTALRMDGSNMENPRYSANGSGTYSVTQTGAASAGVLITDGLSHSFYPIFQAQGSAASINSGYWFEVECTPAVSL